jgi:hypothetical protein
VRPRPGTKVGPVGTLREGALLERWQAQFWMTESTIHDRLHGRVIEKKTGRASASRFSDSPRHQNVVEVRVQLRGSPSSDAVTAESTPAVRRSNAPVRSS